MTSDLHFCWSIVDCNQPEQFLEILVYTPLRIASIQSRAGFPAPLEMGDILDDFYPQYRIDPIHVKSGVKI